MKRQENPSRTFYLRSEFESRSVFKDHDRQYMHIGTMVEFAFALVGKLDVINKHSFNDFRLRVGKKEKGPSRSVDWLYNSTLKVWIHFLEQLR